MAQRLYVADPGLEVVNRHAAGMDIGNESHYVAVAVGRDEVPVREFGSWTADLERMAEWLKACGIQTVVMQSSGVYWMAVFEVIQRQGFEVNLVDARGTKNLPGGKSDVQECQWLLKLHTYGLLRSCFLPPEPIRRLRTVWRLRDQQVKEARQAVQHMPRALTNTNSGIRNCSCKILICSTTVVGSAVFPSNPRTASGSPTSSVQRPITICSLPRLPSRL